MPVSGIGPSDAEAYTRWLDATHRVLGARLCTDVEWERAARGSDTRVFTTGFRMPDAWANVDSTYGQIGPSFGPDEVGSHPESASPFGLEDMQGNALEMVTSTHGGRGFRAKGGCWYYDANYSGRLTTSEHLEAGTRAAYLGFRVCASPKP